MGFMRLRGIVLIICLLLAGGCTVWPNSAQNQVVHPTIAPKLSGRVALRLYGGGDVGPRCIVQTDVVNPNLPEADVVAIRYCFKKLSGDAPLTKAEAQQYIEHPLASTLVANVDVQEMAFYGSPQLHEISEFKGQLLWSVFYTTELNWLSAAFVSSDGAVGPVTDPMRFRMVPTSQLVTPPDEGIEKTFEGRVDDDLGRPLAGAIVQYFHERQFMDLGTTDEAGKYYFETTVPNEGDGYVGLPVFGPSVNKSPSLVILVGDGTTGVSSQETPYSLKAMHSDYTWEPMVYLIPSFTDYSANLSFEMLPPQGGWWMFGRDHLHTRRSSQMGPQDNSVRWSYQTGAPVLSSPAISADGSIYVGSNDFKLYALNEEGILKWTFETGGEIFSSPAIGLDGTVYVGSNDNHLYAILPIGAMLWSLELPDRVTSSPVIGTDNVLYIGCDDGMLYAISNIGEVLWMFESGNLISSSPAVSADGTIYVASHDTNLYAVNKDGTFKWSFATGDIIHSSPAIGTDGTIYFGGLDGILYAVQPDGELKWKYETDDEFVSSVAIGIDGSIYIGCGNDWLYAFDSDGKYLWGWEIGRPIQSSPAIGADGTIYVGSYDSGVYAISASGFSKWTYFTGSSVRSSPALGQDGSLYVGSDDGQIYAFGSNL